jgi:hypothetical protein
MERITDKMLNAKINYLNQLMDTPETSWERTNGKNKSHVGNYHISGAYGGVNLCQMTNESGGVRNVFSCGHVPKRDLFNRIDAYIAGIREQQERGNTAS